MFSSKKENLPSPSLEDSFFPFSSSSSASTKRTMGPGVVPEALSDLSQDDGCTALQESDLVLAAELGQALLERNEELNAQLEQKEKEVEVQYTISEAVTVFFNLFFLSETESFWLFICGISMLLFHRNALACCVYSTFFIFDGKRLMNEHTFI